MWVLLTSHLEGGSGVDWLLNLKASHYFAMKCLLKQNLSRNRTECNFKKCNNTVSFIRLSLQIIVDKTHLKPSSKSSSYWFIGKLLAKSQKPIHQICILFKLLAGCVSLAYYFITAILFLHCICQRPAMAKDPENWGESHTRTKYFT